MAKSASGGWAVGLWVPWNPLGSPHFSKASWPTGKSSRNRAGSCLGSGSNPMHRLKQGTPSLCLCFFVYKMGTIGSSNRSLELGYPLSSPREHPPSRLHDCAPLYPAVSWGASFPCTTLRCLVGSSQQLEEGGSSQENGSSRRTQLAVLESGLPPLLGIPALQHISNPLGSRRLR